MARHSRNQIEKLDVSFITLNLWLNKHAVPHKKRLEQISRASLDIALKTDQWRASIYKVKQLIEKRVFLDTSKLINRLKRIQNYEILTRNRFKGRHIS